MSTAGQHLTRLPALRAAGTAMGQKGLPYNLSVPTIGRGSRCFSCVKVEYTAVRLITDNKTLGKSIEKVESRRNDYYISHNRFMLIV